MIFCVHFACPPVSPSVAGRHLYVRLMRSRGSVARRTRKNKPARQCQPAASPTPTAAKVAAQSRTAYVADAHTGLKNRLTHAFSVLPALPSCFARGNECAAAAKPVTTSSEACPMCKPRSPHRLPAGRGGGRGEPLRRMRTGGRPANPGWPESRPGLRLVRTPMGPRPLSAFELLLKSPRSYRAEKAVFFSPTCYLVCTVFETCPRSRNWRVNTYPDAA
ncbi:hypothetical protein HPB48_023983 [Haemaphysalis longicornis]|uniref:Uncharacterized protein n=1 Tax=Haemaphysalis longicornis TaxID=44386 RepID=A0A9J6H8U4_HAELO|nr:hypothetical protein HPB48_023983 [Haemaphysalis longicornis]